MIEKSRKKICIKSNQEYYTEIPRRKSELEMIKVKKGVKTPSPANNKIRMMYAVILGSNRDFMKHVKL